MSRTEITLQNKLVEIDPFAADFFAPSASDDAGDGAAWEVNRETPSPRRASSWADKLPRVSRAEMQSSATLMSIHPSPLDGRWELAVRTALSRYTHLPPEQVSLMVVDCREKEFRAEETAQEGGPFWGVYASFASAPQFSAPGVIELEANFAAALIDRVLGHCGRNESGVRNLSPLVAPPAPLSVVERSVIEFLWLSVLSSLNEQVEFPAVRSLGLTTEPPAAWRESSPPRGLVVTLLINVEAHVGFARLYLGSETLRSLAASEKSPARVSSAAAQLRRQPNDKRIERARRVVNDAPAALLIGQTEVAPAEIGELGPGDVVIVTRPNLRRKQRRLAGPVVLRVGVGRNISVAGQLSGGDEESASYQLTVDALTGDDLPAPLNHGKITMEENWETPEDEAVAKNATLVEGLLVTMHVELPSRRVRVDELARLRPGQLIDLECEATDPVALVVDGRRVAQGELVDIEGRLGVRILSCAA